MQLTVTKEKAVELKLAGWSKETYFYWESNPFGAFVLFAGDIGDSHMQPFYPAPTITELLEEMDNSKIEDYYQNIGGETVGGLIDLFRSPDRLADAYIFARKEGLI